MRPTLEQISTFALERVNRERLSVSCRNPETIYIYDAKRTAKKFTFEVTIYVCYTYYGYKSPELCKYFKINSNNIANKIWSVKYSKKRLEKAQELLQNLEIINRNNYIGQITEEFSIISGEPNKDIQKLNSFEKWLINRLYETNK